MLVIFWHGILAYETRNLKQGGDLDGSSRAGCCVNMEELRLRRLETWTWVLVQGMWCGETKGSPRSGCGMPD